MPDLLPTDAELFAAVKLNNQKAFNTLFERYWPLVYKKAFFYTHNAEASAEIVDDIFVNIWQKRHVLQIITFKNYLTAAARYRVYNFIKASKASQLMYVEDYEEMDELIAEDNDGDTHIRTTEFNNNLDNVLKTLPERCREIFALSRNQQLSNDEIAHQLGISKRSVENQITHALKHLRMHFKNAMVVFISLYSLFRL
jgi:RNA polymerase sigma-70 factor (family 1)